MPMAISANIISKHKTSVLHLLRNTVTLPLEMEKND